MINTHIWPKATIASLTGPIAAKKLDELLIASGWERTWADANAIGSGTLAAPGFNGPAVTTPAASTSWAKIAYTMPLGGLTNRWVVLIDWRWGSSTNYVDYRVQTATAVDASGNLTGASPARGYAGSSPYSSAGADMAITTNEYGFALLLNTPTRLHVARRRSVNNVYEDDLMLGFQAGFSSNYYGWSNTAQGRSIRRNWATGEFAEQPILYLVGANSTSFVTPGTLSTADNNTGYPLGPFYNSAGLSGTPRLFLEMATGDAVLGSEQSIEVDGQSRLYYCLDCTSGILSASQSSRLLVAKN